MASGSQCSCPDPTWLALTFFRLPVVILKQALLGPELPRLGSLQQEAGPSLGDGQAGKGSANATEPGILRL